MSEEKKFFMLNYDLIHIVSQLPNEKAGELFKHVLSYVNDQNPISDDYLINVTFEPIKRELIDQYNRKQYIINKRVEAGKISGANRGKKKPPRTKKPKIPTTDEHMLTHVNMCSEIIRIFNQICSELPHASLTDERMRLIDRILKNYSLEQIGEVFEKAKQSDFLTGKVQKFRANFNWLLNPSNFVKTLEGNYDNVKVPKILSGNSTLQQAKDSVSKYFNHEQ